MINLQVSDAFVELVDGAALEQAALMALKHEASLTDGDVTADMDLSVVVEDDDHLHELNQQFLGIDAPTDVLSFPSGETEPDPETGQPYLGDVIISYPRALEQSQAAGHPVMAEMQLLTIHGVLHLLGYDHYEPEEKVEMWAAQAAILQALGVEIKRLPE